METAGGAENDWPPAHQVVSLMNQPAKITSPLSAFLLIHRRNANVWKKMVLLALWEKVPAGSP